MSNVMHPVIYIYIAQCLYPNHHWIILLMIKYGKICKYILVNKIICIYYFKYFMTGKLQACFSAAENHDWTFETKQQPQQCFKHSNKFSCNLLQQPKAHFQGPVRAELEQTVTLITHLIYLERSCLQHESIVGITTKHTLISSCGANRKNTRKQWLKLNSIQNLRSFWIKEKLEDDVLFFDTNVNLLEQSHN